MAPAIGIAEWQPLDFGTDAPCGRTGHTMTTVGRSCVMFGGMLEKDNEIDISNETFVLNLDTSPNWQRVQVHSGAVPEGRWKHSAVAVDEDTVLIFGGLADKNKRFDDVWMFKVSSMEWQKVKTSGSSPCPRAHHTATMVGTKMYVWGGYGGHRQRRAFYNDCYALETTPYVPTEPTEEGDEGVAIERTASSAAYEAGDLVWTKIVAGGPAPEPRSDHSTSLIALPASSDNKMLCVMGGRDHMTFFSDIHFLDLSTHEWTTLGDTPTPVLPAGLAHHAALAIASVPNYKIFVFGGQQGGDNRSDWKYVKNVNCLDCGSMQWMSSDAIGSSFVEGLFPEEREDHAYAYDRRTGRILLHGGWSQKFLDDAFYLDVSSIVGPPYAIYKLLPCEGPMTGHTDMTIVGEDFKNGSIKVTFTDGKNTEIVEGKFVSKTKLSCKSPDWQKYSAGEINVRVNIAGEGLTVNIVKWTYFVNTNPRKCVAFGTGLFAEDNCGWGFPAIFKVQAKDNSGRNRNTGGETVFWKPRVQYLGPLEPFVGEDIPVRVEDVGDGTYDMIYVPWHPGQYRVELGYCDPDVQHDEVIPIKGSPWTTAFDDPWSKVKVKDIDKNEPPKALPGTSTVSLMKKVVLYGGDSDEVVCFDPDSNAWERPVFEPDEQAGAKPPPKRFGASFTALDNEKALIIGGHTSDGGSEGGPTRMLSDVHVLACEKGKWKWINANDIPGDKLAPRGKHAACLIPVGKKMVVFGGMGQGGAEAMDSTSVLAAQNLAKMEWFDLETRVAEVVVEESEEIAVTAAPPPPPTEAEKQSAEDQEGHEGEEGEAADIPAAEQEEEAQEFVLPELTEVPGKRHSHGIAAVEGMLYTFGGVTKGPDGKEYPNNNVCMGEFVLNGKTLSKGDAVRWSYMKTHGDIPCARSDFAVSVLDGKIIVQGGRDYEGNALDDIYALDPHTGMWTTMYRSDFTWQKYSHSLSCIVGKRMVMLSAKDREGKSKYEDVRVLEFGKIVDSHAFLPDMSKRIVKEIALLEAQNKDFNTQLKKDPMKSPTEDEQRDVLLLVKNVIYTCKMDQPKIELQMEVLLEALSYLNKQGVATDKMDGDMQKCLENFGQVKKQLPVAVEVIKPVQEREGNKIKASIEKFTLASKTTQKDFGEFPLNKYETGLQAAYTNVLEIKNKFLEMDKEMATLSGYAKVFEFPELIEEAASKMKELHADLNSMLQLWHMIGMVDIEMAEWSKTLWNDINVEEMEDGTKGFYKQLRALDKVTKTSNAYVELEKKVKGFLTALPLVTDLRHQSMRPRHWDMLRELTGKSFDETSPTFDLKTLNDLHLDEFEEDVGEIVNRAQKEEKMEFALEKISKTWKVLEFQFAQHKDTDIHMIKLSEEDFETLEDHQLQIQNMMGSRYLATFEEQVTKWQHDLASVADVVGLMSEIQRTWAYLETLFIGSEEVKKELPVDAERFVGIDVDVKQVLKDIRGIKNAVQACKKDPDLIKKLESTQSKLEMCEKSLANYLEQKRRIFPRFYFVSTSDLLDILSNGNDPVKVNFHTDKIIAAIATLDLEAGATSDDRPSAVGFESSVGVEHITLPKKFKIQGRVEYYMQDIINETVKALRECLKNSNENFVKDSTEVWVKREPNQIILTTSLTFFTLKMEETFTQIAAGDSDAMRKMWQFKIDGLTGLIDLVRTKLTKAERMKIMCLITLDAHSRDIASNLLRDNVTERTQFEWQSQLRFEWREKENNRFINIVDAEFTYYFEYIGNGARLVITPLTDRIYVTATQALKLCMGCAPAGPAGTGKTETTKDLAAMMAVCIYVFNCAPEMDYRSLGDIWKGLGASGAWGCFDEFNRLIAEVLSVCSTQYKCILDALVAGRDKFILDGAELVLNKSVGAYITMNPGYLGRTPLPESLKALFRPVTVVVPDFALICENMLMSEGYTQARLLGVKFINLYTLCGDLLSKAKHYDWGLRAIKSVLRVAGDFKRNEPEVSELALLFRALRDFNTPKIVGDDWIVFQGLLGDLFPGIDIPRQRNWDNEKVISEVCVENHLQPDDNCLLKIVQLDELLSIRHSVFLMGPSGTGKSTCWKMLSGARNKQGDKCTTRDLDPKAILTTDFYGYVNMATREWKDGIFSCILREMANAPDTNSKWVILDGDLDANWIESMNSVMDDNKLLTLASNERIVVKQHMKLIFEIRDLKFATPATASRAGISYIVDRKSQWMSYLQSWVAGREEDTQERKELLLSLFDKYIEETLLAMKRDFKYMAPILDFNIVQTLCNILQGLLTQENCPKGHANDAVTIETYFVFAAIWAFGSPFSITDAIDYRKNFSAWWKSKWTSVKLPAKGLVFDFFVEKGTLKWTPWAQIVEKISYESTTAMDSVTVPTGETASISFYLDLLVKLKKAALLIGLAGAGKTALVNGKLRNLPEEYNTCSINFNFYTGSQEFQAVMEGQLEKKAGRNYGPPGAQKLVYFVDDLNMPQLDVYDTSTAISLLRQYFEYQHWYDLSKLSLRVIQNCQFLCAMNPTCGSFIINPRLQRHFMVFAIGFPGQEALLTIFSTFLNGHVKDFDAKIADQAFQNKVIQAALELHDKVSRTFRKTAANFHYEFSIRHLANVFKGLLMSDPSFFPTPDKFAALFIHEAERVYGDRLVSPAHLTDYMKIAKDTGKKFFKDLNQNEVFPSPHIFCNCWKDLDEKSYNRVESMEKLNKILTDALNAYNETNAAMNLVLFGDAMQHVCRICRIIQSGHALLVGVGGSGKQSLTRLAAFISNCSVSQIVLSGTYSMTDFKEDIKQMYMKAGVKSEQICFLFTDSQIADEKFLVYMNEMLSSGKIPNLFAPDEIDGIYGAVRNEGKAEGIADAKEPMYDFFISKVKRNLHVCLCFSPVGGAFARRASRFPSLINCTVIDWFQPWPELALYDVANRFLQEVDLGEPAARESIVKFMPFSFGQVNMAAEDFKTFERRYNYTTPKSFLELIYLYKNMLEKERVSLFGNIDRLSNGLDKLEKTQKDVAILEEEIKVKSVEVEAAKANADEIATQVGGEKTKVEAAAANANEEAAKCAVIAENAGKMQEDCERDLAAAIPAVQKAEAALENIDKKALQELKNLGKPPGGVSDVTDAILALKGVPKKQWSWDAAKQMMKDVDKFIQNDLKGLKTLIDDSQLDDKNVQLCKPFLELEHVKDLSIMAKKSTAAAGLCDFLLNIVAYYDIVVTVEPKRKALAQAQAELAEANTKLAEVQAYVADLEAKLAVLIAEYDKVVAEKNRVVAEGERLTNKLSLAQRLMAALGSEQARWKINVAKMKDDATLLPGDVLLSASFVSYVGTFNKKYRDRLINDTMVPFLKKNGVPISENADPLVLLATPSTIAEWNSQGLPADRVSVENAAISVTAERWPLMIDPQLQGIVWVKEKESHNNLQITRLDNKKLLSVMEKCLESGMSVMIENVQEALDAVLAPIIARQKIKKGRNFFVKVGDKEVEYHSNFKLFLHTKLANPHYPPEIQAECTLINFMVTESGLEDQLLAKVVLKERPDLEEEKSFLIQQQNEFKIKLAALESSLLKQLAEAEGDLTENIVLIESLEEAKRVSIDVNEKVAIAQETEIKINETREGYREAANRGALLFFALGELFKVHSFYHYSLAAFTAVFLRAIDWAGRKYTGPPLHVPQYMEKAAAGSKSGFFKFRTAQMLLRAGHKGFIGGDEEKGAGKPSTHVEVNLEARMKDLIASITYQVFNFTRRGLFDMHKLLFTTSIAFKVLLRVNQLDADESRFLIFGKKSLSPPPLNSDMAAWCSDVAWAGAHACQELKPLEKLCSDMEADQNKWHAWLTDERPESRDLPGDYNKVSGFLKLILIRQLRPDRLTGALRTWVQEHPLFGKKYINDEIFDIFGIYRESAPETAMYFYLFPGADIVADLDPLMKAKGYTIENGKFINISMGQGQEPVAEEALDRCMKDGGWVFLQNIHLMSGWVKALERKLEGSFDPDTNKDFRCFLSAEPPPTPLQQTIPEAILQNSIKISNEPAKSLGQLLFRAWTNFNQSTLDSCKRPKDFRVLLLGLCVFHACINGRKKFGNMGWNCGHLYGFTLGDLQQCCDVMINQLNARSGARCNEQVPYRDLRYLFGEIMYGGHIVDKFDRRTNITYLDVIITPNIFNPETEVFPGFLTKLDGTHEEFLAHVENDLPPETPLSYGMHPNAEINFLMTEANTLFENILTLSGGGGGGGGSGKSREQMVGEILENLQKILPEDFNMFDIKQAIGENITPYLVVLMQECERFNLLLREIRQDLKEIKMGLEGALNITDKMENSMNSMIIQKVPGPWVSAWRTNKTLDPWFADVVARTDQLRRWSADLVMPPSLWLSGTFNPMAFITAVMQTTARKRGWALDNVVTFTDPTTMDWEEPDAQPDDGAFIHGMFIEGARWDRDSGEIRESFLRDLTPQMPVIHLVAIEASSVNESGYHDTPCYYVSQRGGGPPPGSFVFFTTLKTSEPTVKGLYGVYSYKWVLAGVGLLLQVE